MIARNRGQIVNIVSSGALCGSAFCSSYSSSKAALLSKFYSGIILHRTMYQ
jgi:short-subunit dehydrogenase